MCGLCNISLLEECRAVVVEEVMDAGWERVVDEMSWKTDACEECQVVVSDLVVMFQE